MQINVRACGECPFFSSNSEYPETHCAAAGRDWGMGYWRRGDPIPDWCPLRKSGVLVKLRSKP